MKTVKHILVLLTFIAGLTISANAQTHDNVQPAKAKTQLKKMPKTNIKEKSGVSKTENKNQKTHEAIQSDKKTETTVPAEKQKEKTQSTVPVNKTEQKSGDKKTEKMKEVRRPVKKPETTKAGK